MAPGSRTGFGVLLSLLATMCAAGFLIPFKLAGRIAPTAGVVVALLTCAAVFSTVTTVVQGRVRAINFINIKVAGALAVCSIIGNLAMLRAVVALEPAIASVFAQTQVFFVVVVSWFVLGERPTLRFVIGALVAVAGFGAMRIPGMEHGVVLTGVLWALLAATMWGAMQVITRKWAYRIEPVVVNALRLWMAAIGLAAMPGTASALATVSARAWLYAAIAAFMGPFLARLALMFSVRHITASQSTLVGLVTPVFALGFGLLAFGTTPELGEIVGGAIILMGISIPIAELVRR